jgi:hypothetical protein
VGLGLVPELGKDSGLLRDTIIFRSSVNVGDVLAEDSLGWQISCAIVHFILF